MGKAEGLMLKDEVEELIAAGNNLVTMIEGSAALARTVPVREIRDTVNYREFAARLKALQANGTNGSDATYPAMRVEEVPGC